MDTKQLNQLDPKLKETYERVMGTATHPAPKPNTFIPKPPTTTMPTQPVISPKSQPFPVQPAQPQPIEQSQPVQAQPIQKPQTQSFKKKIKIMPLFIILGGIIFLIGYAFFWTKIFNLKLPFLPF